MSDSPSTLLAMAGPVDRRVIFAGVGIPIAALAVAVAASVGGGDDPVAAPTATVSTALDGPDTTVPPATVDEEWNEALVAALEPLGGVLVELASSVDAWSQGGLGDDELGLVVDRARPVVASVREGAAAIERHPDDPLARPLIEQMAELYVASVDAHGSALTADGALRGQYDLLGRRLRILADRVFDRARERTSAPVDPGPDITLVLPAEVPDWERLEVAAGPPLEGTDPNRSGELPREREDERSSQEEVTWLDDVEALAAPTVGEVRAAFGDVERLGDLARRLVGAAEGLRDVPVPDDDRGRADRVALGWLIRADGARAAQLAALDDRRPGLADAVLAVSDDPVFAPA
jgi:hypothetical protein